MITNKDIEALSLSPTNRDYVRVWNELIDVSKKLSAIWDPTSTNESDPMIVLFKIMTAYVDKLNYNIDKDALEVLMPTAAQLESMRAICSMMGYDMKYYTSAETELTINYTSAADKSKHTVRLPQFTPFKNADQSVTYVTTEAVNLVTNMLNTVNVIEGEVVMCESDNENIISLEQLDDNFRYYLPEVQIAENGIFVYNLLDTKVKDKAWEQVTNLNTVSLGTACYKFGYDSTKALPYIQFPEDVGQLIEDGLIIYYVRTQGANGNIAANELVLFDTPSSWSTPASDGVTFSAEDFTVTNPNAASNGANSESITSAYNNFNKTVGTFDTLVTCRDYMNKIYQFVDENNIPYVSNIIVSDIRDDINYSNTLCTFGNDGIEYEECPTKDSEGNELLTSFNLLLYPFNTVTGLNTKEEYKNSFAYSEANLPYIKAALNDTKNMAHVYRTPGEGDIVCVKNYLKLNAKITTKTKVNDTAEKAILKNIKTALYKNFNMRNLDFGEEIPFDSILEVIQNADENIKNVALEDPDIETKIVTTGDQPYEVNKTYTGTEIVKNAKYNKLALRNILAGRITMFDYDTTFKYRLDSAAYPESIDTKIKYPHDDRQIISISPSCIIDAGSCSHQNVTLADNEIIQFRAPNLRTTKTYPAYVNYYFDPTDKTKVIPANTDYKLVGNDKLYINYTTTDSTTNKDKVVNEVYKAGDIIRPNFILKCSKQTDSKKYAKTSGFTFVGDPLKDEGMLSLGADEQIEIRDQVSVKLDSAITYLYWVISPNNYLSGDDKGRKFPFTWTKGDNTNIWHGKYILQDDEYLFYTDRNKINLVYYGAGTEIEFVSTSKNELTKTDQADISMEDIAKKGMAAIPWVRLTLDTNKSYINVNEYQYVNLVAKDTLVEATTDVAGIYYKWNKVIGEVKYKYYEEKEESLPTLPSGMDWEVRSRLEVNVGPNTTQTLINDHDVIKITYNNNTTETISPKTVNGTVVPLSIRTNYAIQSSADTISTKVSIFDEDDNETVINDFSIMTFKDVPITINGQSATEQEHNFGSFWTKYTLKYKAEAEVGDKGTKFNVIIPNNTYGLIAIYYTTEESDIDKYSSIAFTNDTDNKPTIFNYNNGDDDHKTWWKDYYNDDKYRLKPGLNIIKVTKSTEIVFTAGTNKLHNIVISDIDIVKGINPLLDYKVATTTTGATIESQLLADINEQDRDHEFYYNTPVENAYAIDLNISNGEKLSSPRVWYDHNNINNKFVISEIDSDNLSGIAIAKSSKL